MSKVPGDISYNRVVAALCRDGWVPVRTTGGHIHMRRVVGGIERTTVVPARRPVERRILAKILKQTGISLDRFLELL